MISSRPVLEFDVELSTRQAQSMRNWLTDNLGGMLYMLEVVFMEQQAVSESVSQALNDILSAFDDLDDELLACIEDQEKMPLPDQKIRLKYSSPKTLSVECSTPQLLCCQQLLCHFDQVVQGFDRQWLFNQISRKKHRQQVLHWMQKVSAVLFECNKIYRSVRHQALSHSESENDETVVTDNVVSLPSA